MLSDTAILTHIARQTKRQAGYKQLVRELGLHGEERRELNDHLQKLVKSGQLIPSTPIVTPSPKPPPTRTSSPDVSPCTATDSASLSQTPNR